MAFRVVFVVALFLFCTSKVSSDSEIEEDTHHFNQAFNVITRGANRNLMQDIVVKLSKATLAPAPTPTPTPLPTPAPAQAPTLTPTPTPGHIDCDGLCKHRCSAHSRQNVCLRACGTCCIRCKCVPPGTYGNKEVCGKCYTEMTTHGNKPKCP